MGTFKVALDCVKVMRYSKDAQLLRANPKKAPNMQVRASEDWPGRAHPPDPASENGYLKREA